MHGLGGVRWTDRDGTCGQSMYGGRGSASRWAEVQGVALPDALGPEIIWSLLHGLVSLTLG